MLSEVLHGAPVDVFFFDEEGKRSACLIGFGRFPDPAIDDFGWLLSIPFFD